MPEDCKETIFEGATFSDISTFVDAHYDKVTEMARCQMKQVQSGAQAAKWKAYKECYGMQANQIIEDAEATMQQAAKQKSGRGSKKSQVHQETKKHLLTMFCVFYAHHQGCSVALQGTQLTGSWVLLP